MLQLIWPIHDWRRKKSFVTLTAGDGRNPGEVVIKPFLLVIEAPEK